MNRRELNKALKAAGFVLCCERSDGSLNCTDCKRAWVEDGSDPFGGPDFDIPEGEEIWVRIGKATLCRPCALLRLERGE